MAARVGFCVDYFAIWRVCRRILRLFDSRGGILTARNEDTRRPIQFSLRTILWVAAACGVLFMAFRPKATVQQVEGWLSKLPSNATSADVKRLLVAKRIPFHHTSPDPPHFPNGRINGFTQGVDWMGRDIDIEVEIDANDRVAKIRVHKGLRGL